MVEQGGEYPPSIHKILKTKVESFLFSDDVQTVIVELIFHQSKEQARKSEIIFNQRRIIFLFPNSIILLYYYYPLKKNKKQVALWFVRNF